MGRSKTETTLDLAVGSGVDDLVEWLRGLGAKVSAELGERDTVPANRA
jgi:hypothetical protein